MILIFRGRGTNLFSTIKSSSTHRVKLHMHNTGSKEYVPNIEFVWTLIDVYIGKWRSLIL